MRNPHNDPLRVQESDGSLGRGNTPERRCVLTGNNGTRDEMLRLALSPDGLVLPDVQAKAPGRGAWIAVSQAELETALANGKLKGALARAFKTGALTIPDDLADMYAKALRRALTDRLGLELRSGKLVLGSGRIADEARMGRVAALYHAADARDDGARKLDQAWRVGSDAEGSGKAGIRLPLDRDALSVALGRDNVVHLALSEAASAGRVLAPLTRLLNYMGTAEAVHGSAGRVDLSADAGAAG